MKAPDILAHAAELVATNRESAHGQKRVSFENIARLWNAYLATRRDPSAPLSATDVGHLMVLLKVARTQLGDFNPDDYTDMAGYAGCTGEIAHEEER